MYSHFELASDLQQRTNLRGLFSILAQVTIFIGRVKTFAQFW